jgi:hypothetical protein
MKQVKKRAKVKPKAKRSYRAVGAQTSGTRVRKSAAADKQAKSRPKEGMKAKPFKVGKGRKTAVLSGGNPHIAKEDGDAPVQAYIGRMPGWKRDLGKHLDALIVRAVPHVRKAVKWNSPFYGIEGQGWFLGIHTFTHYVKVAFFQGMSLRPLPPGRSRHKEVRYIDIRQDDELDEAQMASWVKQAAALPGFLGPQRQSRPPGADSVS